MTRQPIGKPFWDRLRWARHEAGFERPTDAARSLGIKPVTYRTYECSPEEGSRLPPLTEIQRIARKFNVDWVWLASGEGLADRRRQSDPKVIEILDAADDLPDDKRDDALAGALGVIRAFKPR